MKIQQIIDEGLGYSQDPAQAKWYHEGRKAYKFGTSGNVIQDIAKKHGCPPEWLKAFHAGYQDQEGWGKDNINEFALGNAVSEGAEEMTPNWAKYVLDQIYNSNGDVTLTDLFDEGIPGLHDMFMATAQKHGFDPEEDFEDVQHELTLELEDLIKGGYDIDEGNKKPEPPEADYGDDYQDMVARVKKLAGMGPLKTVYDPNKRVYKNVPTAVQPSKSNQAK
jgi:hypothetical protein